MFGRKNKAEPMDNTAVRGGPVPLSEATVDDWLNAAKGRYDSLFDEMDAVMQQAFRREPVRIFSMRRDMKWLRKEAGKLGLEWGT